MKFLAATMSGSILALAICGSSGATEGVGKRAQTDVEAIRNTNRFAWKVFSEICRPHVSQGNNNADWETWADDDLVFGHPQTEPTWPDPTGQKVSFVPSIQFHPELAQALQEDTSHPTSQSREAVSKGMHQLIEPSGAGVEVRMNEPTLRYIVRHQLWFQEGLIARFKANKDIDFPKESREIKAEWIPISEGDKGRYHWNYDKNGNLYGLIALHITTKDLPNWFWATFEQVDRWRAGYKLPYTDTFGFKGDAMSVDLKHMFQAKGLGNEWSNYRLVGTQTTFYDRHGKPTLCGNDVIEGFPRNNLLRTSSCISCHQESTTSADGNFLDNQYSYDPPAGYLGSFDTNLLIGPDGKRLFIKRDFVWSFIHAQSRALRPLTPAASSPRH